MPSSLTRYWYLRTGLPPSDAGAVQDRTASVSPAAALRLAGAPGTVTGVAVSSAGLPSPTLFTARTWKVCSVPLARPVTVYDLSSSWSVPASGPSGTSLQSGYSPVVLKRYWYLRTALPPSDVGAVQDRTASVSPAAVRLAGAPGGLMGSATTATWKRNSPCEKPPLSQMVEPDSR